MCSKGARLSLKADELSAIKAQLTDIISYFELLEAYNTDDVDVDLGRSVGAAALREDLSRDGVSREDIAGFASGFEEGYFVVPRILGDEDNA